MKVAIMGAGLSGLTCALILERSGIPVEIYEKRHRVGERFENIEAVMQIMHRPIKDPLAYIGQRYGINLIPSAVVHTLEIESPNVFMQYYGRALGYSSVRGHNPNSWENQLYRSLKSHVYFNASPVHEELAAKYDKVVIATGDPIIAMEMNLWKTDVEVFLKGCAVSGEFNTGLTRIWLDTELASSGYVYFAPYDNRCAYYCLAATPSSPQELDKQWGRVVKRFNLTPEQGSVFKFDEFKIGTNRKRHIGPFIFVGNAGGFVDPFLGFGQIPSIISGAAAAESILTGKPFDELVGWWDQRYAYTLQIRRYMGQMTNEGFDRVVSMLNRFQKVLFGTEVPALPLLGMLSGVLSRK